MNEGVAASMEETFTQKGNLNQTVFAIVHHYRSAGLRQPDFLPAAMLGDGKVADEKSGPEEEDRVSDMREGSPHQRRRVVLYNR